MKRVVKEPLEEVKGIKRPETIAAARENKKKKEENRMDKLGLINRLEATEPTLLIIGTIGNRTSKLKEK